MELVKLVYEICLSFPKQEIYGLSSQMKRCAVSIPSNIAEGASRSSEKEFKRFIEIALGSSFELETQIILSNELQFLSSSKMDEIVQKTNIIQKQMSSLRKRLMANG